MNNKLEYKLKAQRVHNCVGAELKRDGKKTGETIQNTVRRILYNWYVANKSKRKRKGKN